MAIAEDQIFAKAQLKKAIAAVPVKLIDKENLIAQKVEFSHLSPLKKLKLVYDLVDSLSQHVGKFSACKRGCDSCCHYPVSLHGVEIEYIEKHERIKRDKSSAEGDLKEGAPCPFLKNKSCQIYNSRPFVCRIHYAFTKNAKWCEEDVSNKYEFAQLNLSEARRALFAIAKESDAGGIVEIRRAFKSRWTRD